VAFKQNLPAVAILASAGLIVGFIVLLQPPDEDQLRQAAAAHVKTMDKVGGFEVRGEVVDVLRADGSVSFLAFAKRDGAWRFDRDLAQDFDTLMKDPAASREIVERLGRRIGQRFNTGVSVPQGLRYAYRVFRDPTSVVGEVAVSFDYPQAQGKPAPGRYVETFRWTSGRWENQGVGALYDAAHR
jgi:hypothetical protein